MAKTRNSIWPFVLSVVSLALLPILFYVALSNVAPLNTAPGVFVVPFIPMTVAVVALFMNKKSKFRAVTITIAVLALVFSTMTQLFFIGSVILWSAG